MQLVVDVAHAGHALDTVLRAPLHLAIVDGASERHLTTLHGDLDVARVDDVVIGQRLAHELANPLVRALKSARAFAAVGAAPARTSRVGW